MRKRILDYLQAATFSGAIERIVDAQEGGLTEAVQTVEEVQSSIEASELRGQAARALESYPQQPGLRLLRAVAEAMVARPSIATIEENAQACVSFAEANYRLDPDSVWRACGAAAQVVGEKRPDLGVAVVRGVLLGAADRLAAARWMRANVPRPLSKFQLLLSEAVLDPVARLITESNSQ